MTGEDRHKSVLQHYDIGHLHQPVPGMRRYRGKLSKFDPLGIEVLVMAFGKIADSTFKEPYDSIGGIKRDFCATRCAVPRDRFGGWFRYRLTFYNSQFNFLSLFKTNLCEGFKNPILV